MTGPAPNREAILTSLERLLGWSEILRSQQLAKFLDYIVRRKLDGDEHSIKAYSIAVDVFGRAADFDPQADPIVRVQARRLRSLLDDYYRGPGEADPTQIRLPVGRYIPDFIDVSADRPSVRGPPLPPSRPLRTDRPPGRLPMSWFVLAVIAMGTAMAAFALSRWGPLQDQGQQAIGVLQRPTVNVMEFQDLSANGGMPLQVSGLAIELVTDLEQFETIAVRYGGGEVGATPAGPSPNHFVLTGIVRPDGDVVQYSAILTESRTGSVVWNQTRAVPAAEAVSANVLDRVSKSIALVLGSPRGPLHVAARQLLGATSLQQSEVNLYLCRMLFDFYRETGGGVEAQRADDCFMALPDAERQSAEALAAMASIIAEYGGAAIAGDTVGNERFGIAGANIGRAVALDPISGFVWEQQARLHEAQGQMALARADFASSVQLNPANADALAAFARVLALAGAMSEAEPLARDAAEGSPNPPPWYHGVPALLALRDQLYPEAIAEAELYAQADRELGPILAIMAAQRAGQGEVVNRYLPQVLDVATFRARGVLPRLRQRITDDRLVDSIRAALLEAGVPVAALIRPF